MQIQLAKFVEGLNKGRGISLLEIPQTMYCISSCLALDFLPWPSREQRGGRNSEGIQILEDYWWPPGARFGGGVNKWHVKDNGFPNLFLNK